ncbi:MAG TPA: hypothetical protein VLN59_09470, partial [Burkholderiales bacterium]|nr:hypothetical protein [Burkholderiales bacterium]
MGERLSAPEGYGRDLHNWCYPQNAAPPFVVAQSVSGTGPGKSASNADRTRFSYLLSSGSGSRGRKGPDLLEKQGLVELAVQP